MSDTPVVASFVKETRDRHRHVLSRVATGIAIGAVALGAAACSSTPSSAPHAETTKTGHAASPTTGHPTTTVATPGTAASPPTTAPRSGHHGRSSGGTPDKTSPTGGTSAPSKSGATEKRTSPPETTVPRVKVTPVPVNTTPDGAGDGASPDNRGVYVGSSLGIPGSQLAKTGQLELRQMVYDAKEDDIAITEWLAGDPGSSLSAVEDSATSRLVSYYQKLKSSWASKGERDVETVKTTGILPASVAFANYNPYAVMQNGKPMATAFQGAVEFRACDTGSIVSTSTGKPVSASAAAHDWEQVTLTVDAPPAANGIPSGWKIAGFHSTQQGPC